MNKYCRFFVILGWGHLVWCGLKMVNWRKEKGIPYSEIWRIAKESLHASDCEFR